MKKFILIYGVISGAVIIGSMIFMLSVSGGDSSDMAGLEWLGYLIMIVAFSVIFVGNQALSRSGAGRGHPLRHRPSRRVGHHRDRRRDLCRDVGGVSRLDGHRLHRPVHGLPDRRGGGSRLEELTAEMERMKEGYANPFFRIPITFLEILPVGLLVSLIAAAVLRKSHVLPAEGGGMVSSAT